MLNATVIRWSLALLVSALAIGLTTSTEAKGRRSVECCESECEACDEPSIRYHHHGTLRKICKFCECSEPVEAVLGVTDPCCEDNSAEIPVCLPPCCEGEPTVCASVCLGRGVVEYEWCCGFRVKVIFQKRGNIAVHTYGR